MDGRGNEKTASSYGPRGRPVAGELAFGPKIEVHGRSWDFGGVGLKPHGSQDIALRARQQALGGKISVQRWNSRMRDVRGRTLRPSCGKSLGHFPSQSPDNFPHERRSAGQRGRVGTRDVLEAPRRHLERAVVGALGYFQAIFGEACGEVSTGAADLR